jgi:hypothetical protein
MQRSLQPTRLGKLSIQLARVLPGLFKEHYSCIRRAHVSGLASYTISVGRWWRLRDVPSVRQFVACCTCAARAMYASNTVEAVHVPAEIFSTICDAARRPHEVNGSGAWQAAERREEPYLSR